MPGDADGAAVDQGVGAAVDAAPGMRPDSMTLLLQSISLHAGELLQAHLTHDSRWQV